MFGMFMSTNHVNQEPATNYATSLTPVYQETTYQYCSTSGNDTKLTVNAVCIALQSFFIRQAIVKYLFSLICILEDIVSFKQLIGHQNQYSYMFQTIPLTSTLSIDMKFIIKPTVIQFHCQIDNLLLELFPTKRRLLNVVQRPI